MLVTKTYPGINPVALVGGIVIYTSPGFGVSVMKSTEQSSVS